MSTDLATPLSALAPALPRAGQLHLAIVRRRLSLQWRARRMQLRAFSSFTLSRELTRKVHQLVWWSKLSRPMHERAGGSAIACIPKRSTLPQRTFVQVPAQRILPRNPYAASANALEVQQGTRVCLGSSGERCVQVEAFRRKFRVAHGDSYGNTSNVDA